MTHWNKEAMKAVLDKISETFAATNVYSRTADDLTRVKKTFVEHLMSCPPYDVVDSLHEWVGGNPNFPTVADIKKLVGEKAARRFAEAPRLSLSNPGDGKTDSRTFDERAQWAARIYRMLCDGADKGLNAHPGGLRGEWIAAWMRSSIKTDCYLLRITAAYAAALHAELDRREQQAGLAAGTADLGMAMPEEMLAAHCRNIPIKNN